MKNLPLCLPGSIQGFRSTPVPVALGEQHASLLQNARLGTGVVTARQADAALQDMPASGRVAGFFECSWNGVLTWFIAISDGTTAKVYARIYGGAGWAEITAASGQYGNTRIPCTSSQNVYFSIATDVGYGYSGYYNTDCVIMQNGTDSPRMFALPPETSTVNLLISSGVTSIIITPLVPPTTNTVINGDSAIQVGPDTNKYLLISTQAAPTLGHSVDGHFIPTVGGSSSGYYSWVFTRDTTASTTTTATVYGASSVNFTGEKQLIFVIGNTTDQTIFAKIKIEITDGTSYTTVYDQTTSSAVILQASGSTTGASGQNFYQIAVPVPVSPAGNSLSACKGVRVTWTTDPPASSLAFEIVAVMGASTDYGGSNFGIAYYGSNYRTYGPGRILAKYGVLLTSTGCSKAYSALRFTEDETVFCSYQVYAPNSGVTTVGQVADWMMVYRNDPGQTGYYWIARKYMYTWGGASWFAVDSVGVQYTSSGEVQDLSHRIPDAFAIGMPAGTAMASCNNRIFVCSGSRLYYSGYQRPFEYRVIVRYIDVTTPDDTSPGSFNKDGETLMAIAPLGVIDVGQESIGSPPNSAASLHYWTNRGFYRVSGFDATSLNKSITISPNGTLSPFSIARGRNLVYWLDEQQRRGRGPGLSWRRADGRRLLP
jgi:hypothetical protein